MAVAIENGREIIVTENVFHFRSLELSFVLEVSTGIGLVLEVKLYLGTGDIGVLVAGKLIVCWQEDSENELKHNF